jgi:preprotein translocase subunit SecA
VSEWLETDDTLTEEKLGQRILEQIMQEYQAKEALWSAQGVDMRLVEKQIMLQLLDQRWKEHLGRMDHLRQGIHLRAYAQKQPKQEYKRESFELFQELLANIKRDVVRFLSRVQIEAPEAVEEAERRRREEAERRMRFTHAEASALGNPGAEGGSGAGPAGAAAAAAERPETFVRGERKIGRNEPCPCGSGKKYKHCHGQVG